MSISIMSQLWASKRASGGSLLVLLALADSASDEGLAWISVPTIAAKARLTDRHVRRLLVDLVASGALEEIGPHPDRRYRGAIVYRLQVANVPLTFNQGSDVTPDICSTVPLTSEPATPDAGVSQSIRNPEESARTESSPKKTLKDKALAVVQRFGGKLMLDGDDLFEAEWLPAFRGRRLPEVISIFETANGPVRWPSDFLELRSAWEGEFKPDALNDEDDNARRNEEYAKQERERIARALAERSGDDLAPAGTPAPAIDYRALAAGD